MVADIAQFVSREWHLPVGTFSLDLQPVGGGLEATVLRARIIGAAAHSAIPSQFVVKHVPNGCDREARVYRTLWRHLEQPPTVRMIGLDVSVNGTYLYLEDAQPTTAWPWPDTERAGAVCRALARLHDDDALPHEHFEWNYEEELGRSAHDTLEVAHNARDLAGQRLWHCMGDLRRVVAGLPEMRQRLVGGRRVIVHGDMHPGNVILRDGSDPEVLLIDWARARLGSPLEDVASWLHSLGCWEPAARRRHDTLIRVYFQTRRTPRRFANELRVDYWLASACNGLAGAIRYHLAVLSDVKTSEEARYNSIRALTAWIRVIRRAAALLPTIRDRRI